MVVIVAVFLVPTLVLAVVVVAVFMPAATVPIVVAVPMMVVFEMSARAVPVSAVVAPAFIPWHNPDCALIRPARPVAPVPVVVSADRIPVAFHPGVLIDVLWFGARRPNRIHTWLRWRSDDDSDRNLAE